MVFKGWGSGGSVGTPQLDATHCKFHVFVLLPNVRRKEIKATVAASTRLGEVSGAATISIDLACTVESI
jgi:hypothetical protein